MNPVYVILSLNREQKAEFRLENKLVLGRQKDATDVKPFEVQMIEEMPDSRGQVPMLVIAGYGDEERGSYSQRHAMLELRSDQTVWITNISKNFDNLYRGNQNLARGVPHKLASDGDEVGIHEVVVRIATDGEVRAFDSKTHSIESLACPSNLGTVSHYSPEKLLLDLKSVVELFKSAAKCDDFMRLATNAMVDICKLDIAAACYREQEKWVTKHLVCGNGVEIGKGNWEPSRTILNRVWSDPKHTIEMGPPRSQTQSVAEVNSLVAAPVLQFIDGPVECVLYGDRRSSGDRSPATPFDIQVPLVDMIANAATVGLTRLKATKDRALLGQFFGENLADELVEHPELLEGKQTSITVLFADIRQFSHITTEIGSPELLVAWIRDVLGMMSECTFEHDGVVVDYIGDEIMSMWGAPKGCLDSAHAQAACRAAQSMIDKIVQIDKKWRTQADIATEISIGICTGTAHVGNTGSDSKIKYGPLGDIVNRASRIQGVAKQLNASIVISDETKQLLVNGGFDTRCLGDVQVVNMEKAFQLHELRSGDLPDEEWATTKEHYERGLKHLQNNERQEAIGVLGRLFGNAIHDQPSLKLLQRAIRCSFECPPTQKCDVWHLDSK